MFETNQMRLQCNLCYGKVSLELNIQSNFMQPHLEEGSVLKIKVSRS
jgi:hypothetical protein